METGLECHILTNGKTLNSDIIEKSKKANIRAYLVSMENPLEQSAGAPKTKEILEKIKTLNNREVNVLPAIMIIRNHSFKYIYDIA